MQEGKRLNVVIDNNLHRNLKVQVAKQETTMSQFVTDAIIEKIERQREDESGGTKKD